MGPLLHLQQWLPMVSLGPLEYQRGEADTIEYAGDIEWVYCISGRTASMIEWVYHN
jgi:hypothetical protein